MEPEDYEDTHRRIGDDEAEMDAFFGKARQLALPRL
jgi:hypothetical protein